MYFFLGDRYGSIFNLIINNALARLQAFSLGFRSGANIFLFLGNFAAGDWTRMELMDCNSRKSE
jgi:hypothetical protein